MIEAVVSVLLWSILISSLVIRLYVISLVNNFEVVCVLSTLIGAGTVHVKEHEYSDRHCCLKVLSLS